MLRITVCMSADGAEKYFDAALKRSDYYAKECGLWAGKGAERLGLKGEVEREDFVSLLRNVDPNTGERLTARTNGKREERRFDRKTGQWVIEEKENRRAGYDLTFSVPKSLSIYLARTGDELAERLAHKALEQTMAEVEAAMQCQVKVRGEDGRYQTHYRQTGEMLYATFIHRESRPIGGRSDMHWHAHVFAQNATWDPVENRWKAGEFGDIKAHAPWFQEVFHDRLAENLHQAGYGIRRTEKGWELECITDEEVALFSKRTRQIEDEARVNDRKLWASARALAKEQNIDLADAYAIRKAELGGKTRKGKGEAVLSREEQREDWRQQMGAERWDAITPELARSGLALEVLDPEEAKQKALEHVFRSQSVASETVLAAELLKRGVGSVSREEAKEWVRSDPRFVESAKEPGRFTTREILAEEKRIHDLAITGRGNFEPLSQGKAWTVTDKNLDAGQLGAVKLIMEIPDLAVAVSGKPGTGKSTAIRQAAAAIEETTGQKPVVLAPSARAVEAVWQAADSQDAATVDRLMVDERLQQEAAGRVIFCDESSLLDNRRAEWLLTFARDHGCRLVLWGDERQHDAVERGTPFRDLLEAQAIERAHLEKIYRQKDERLLAAVEDFHAGRYEKGFERVEQAGMILEADNEAEALRAVVEESLEVYREGQEPLVIALQHRHGEAIAEATRERLKASGMIGSQDIEVRRLEHVDLSDAQRSDPVCYQPGMVAQFHRLAAGGFRSGHQYEVERVEDGQVITRDEHGKERPLPLHQAEAFQVYRQDTLKVAEGERVAITRNDLRAGFRNGDRWKVEQIDGDRIRLENGLVLDASKGLHVRQGYTVTSPASQGHKTAKTLAFLPASAEPGIDGKQMTVTVSRGVYGLSIHTDSKEVLREAATRGAVRESAWQHTQVREQQPAAPVRETERQPAREVDLHAPSQKPSRQQVEAFEKTLRELAAQKYPAPDPDLARRIERTIARKVQQYATGEASKSKTQQQARQKTRQHTYEPPTWTPSLDPDPSRGHDRGISMGR